MRIARILLIAASFLANGAFAQTFVFKTQQDNQPLYQTQLPLAVYHHARRDHLQDLTVTNAAGEQVPYSIFPYAVLHPQTLHQPEEKSLPFFALQENRLQQTDALNVMIAKGINDDTAININAQSTASQEKRIYLVDAGEKHLPLKTLKVDWHGLEGKLLNVEMQSSDDLKSWRNAGSGVLLKTSADGHTLLQNTLKLDTATEARYLQLRLVETEPLGFNLNKIYAVYESERILSPAGLWQEIPLLERVENKKEHLVELDYETLGRYPATALRVQLPQINTMTQVSIFVRNKPDAAWQYIATHALYHMETSGKSFTNPDIEISNITARYWRLQFNQQHGGLGQENPKLSLGWQPDTLVWNARGSAPFILHVGENPDAVNAVSVDILIPDYKIAKVNALPAGSLLIASQQNVAHHANSWISPPDYKRWLLWGGLFLGVLLLAGMAYSLIKAEK